MTEIFVNFPRRRGRQLELSFYDFEDSKPLRDFIGAAITSLQRGRRQRAAAAFGVLGERLLEFAAEIDSGIPLVEAIARRFKVRPGTIRRFRRIPASDLLTVDSSLEELLPLIERTPPDLLPKGDFWQCFVTAHRKLQKLSDAACVSYERLVAKSAGRWYDLATLDWPDGMWLARPLDAAYRDVFLAEVLVRARSFGFRFDHETIVSLLGAPPADVRAVLGAHFFGGKGPRAVYDAIYDWNSCGASRFALSLPGGERARAMLVRFPAWQPLFPPRESPEGLRLVSLATPSELIDEGLSLGHCIGRYVHRCCYGPFHAVSIRTQCGFRLTTAMLEERPDGTLDIHDHRGAANITPDRRAVRALEWLLDEIRARRVHVNFALLRHARQKRLEAAGGEDAATRHSYQIHSPTVREWVFRAYYAPYLRAEDRDLSRDKWLERTGLAARADQMTEALMNRQLAA
jgi:hypothetical protein